MRIIFPLNELDAGKCGVTDYSLGLARALRANGIDVVLTRLSELHKFIFSGNDREVLHIQYPCLDSRYSMLPQIYSHLGLKTVITFHETQTLHKLRRVSLNFFKYEASIVTNNFDYTYVTNHLTKGIVEKIELAPPFLINNEMIAGAEGVIKVCYFGLMRDGKNIQDVFSFSNLLSTYRPDVEFHIVCGSAPSDAVRRSISEGSGFSKNVIWHIGTPTEYLPNLLASFDMAFLPFPNGADENRSSLLSVISAGVIPIVYASPRTPSFMRSIFFVCDCPEMALSFIPTDRNTLVGRRLDILSLSKNYSWESVAKRHIRLYSRVLRDI